MRIMTQRFKKIPEKSADVQISDESITEMIHNVNA